MDEREGLPLIFAVMMLAGLMGAIIVILGVLATVARLIFRFLA